MPRLYTIFHDVTISEEQKTLLKKAVRKQMNNEREEIKYQILMLLHHIQYLNIFLNFLFIESHCKKS
jgi:hypothetical protein